MYHPEEIIENINRCPHMNECSRNLCPLDFELAKRTGRICDICRWMREFKQKEIKGQEFISGGKAMPDRLLRYVPAFNYKWLNKASQKRWDEVNKEL